MLERDIQESPGEILVSGHFYPWQETLAQKEHNYKLCVFGSGTDWKIQTIQDFDDAGNGKTRMYLPEEWAGLNALDLQLATGIKDAEFCHNGRFIAGASSKAGAMNMANLAILLQSQQSVRLAATAMVDSTPLLDPSVYLTPVTTDELRGARTPKHFGTDIEQTPSVAITLYRKELQAEGTRNTETDAATGSSYL